MSDRPRRRPRLRTVLLLVNLAILALPLAGIGVLRIYENELVRGTEAQLLVLGALLRDAYAQAYATQVAGPPPEFTPLEPSLDLGRNRVLPAAEEGTPPLQPPDPLAVTAAARLQDVLASSVRTTLTGVRLVDAAGTVVASSGTELGLSLRGRAEVQAALQGRPRSLLRERTPEYSSSSMESISRRQRYRVFVAVPVHVGGRVVGAVVLSRTPLDLPKALYLQRRALALGASVVLAVVVAVALATAFLISRPLGALVRQAERVERGEKGARVEVPRPGTYEVARLSEALARMSATLEGRADQLRTFTNHLSHELKTPLTSLRGAVELLRDHLHTMSPEERGRFLDLLDASSARLEQLVRRMLDLARAEAAAPGTGSSRAGEVLAETVAQARSTGLDVGFQNTAGEAEVPLPPDILQEIVGNLLDNARLHGGDGVRVQVTLERDRRGVRLR
ncbi:MAG TPA: histidine kinase dimerization/phospho-acceptor domain-containing protein, partial [Candidatus Polarisedimenticolaceae bacterium]|nr:histidine kinase dimerization/phospho-acceptor domain-containing protein [Candidatus Polarisedimenticolaceae bacterium]